MSHVVASPGLCCRDPEASEVVASVLVEEMLHMTLTANLLNAVGGHPQLDSPRMLPGYPRCLPHGDCSFEVPLLRFSREALDVFLKIECPEAPGAPPESDAYETIGQFTMRFVAGCARCARSSASHACFAATRLARSPMRRSRAEAGSSRSTVSPRRSRRSTKSWNKVRALRMSRCDFPSFRRRVCHKSVRRSVIAGTRTTTLNRITTEGT